MGTGGGSQPRGMVQRHARTLFLRAPYREWGVLSTGHQRAFCAPRVGAAIPLAPTPVVLYAISPSKRDRKSKVMVLSRVHEARLADFSHDGHALAAQNCQTYDEFRRYWRARTHREFRPLEHVAVYWLESWTARAASELGGTLLKRLYGDYLDKQPG